MKAINPKNEYFEIEGDLPIKQRNYYKVIAKCGHVGKGYIHDETGAETEWRGDFQAFRRYNGNTNPPPASAETERTQHRDYYADRVLELSN